MKSKLMEILADAIHEQWASWVNSLLNKTEWHDSDGSIIIPKEKVASWKHLANTPYLELTEDMKELDRRQVRKIIVVVLKYLHTI